MKPILAIILLVAFLLCVVLAIGLYDLVSSTPISKAAKIQFRSVANEPTAETETLRLFGTEELFHIAKRPLLENEDMLSADRTIDSNRNPAIELQFTAEGGATMSRFAKSRENPVVALVIDGELMLVTPVRSEIKQRAIINGNMSYEEVKRLYIMLTADRVLTRNSP